MVAAIARVQAEAQRFPLPLLVLHGSADRMVPPDGSRAFVAQVRHPDRELREYPGAYHVLFADLDRGRVLTDWSDGSRPGSEALGRALRLRCPQCGGGPIFVTWSHLVPNCPACGLGLERGEQGYWLGAYFFNLMGVETLFSVWVVGMLWWFWPDPPWTLLPYRHHRVDGDLAVRLLSLLQDPVPGVRLWVRPPTEADFTLPHEAARRHRTT